MRVRDIFHAIPEKHAKIWRKTDQGVKNGDCLSARTESREGAASGFTVGLTNTCDAAQT